MADTDYTAGFRAGQMNEQERIIKLIHWETRPKKLADMFTDLEKAEIRHEIVISFLIFLIKEGNK